MIKYTLIILQQILWHDSLFYEGMQFDILQPTQKISCLNQGFPN